MSIDEMIDKLAKLNAAFNVDYLDPIIAKLRSMEARLRAAEELAKVVEKYTVGGADFNDLYRTTDAYRAASKGE